MRTMRFRLTSVLAIVASGTLGTISVGQEYTLTRWTIDGGGAMRAEGDGFETSGTIGQPDAGIISGGGFELAGGFWFALNAADCNEDGATDLLDHQVFDSCLGGPAGTIPVGCECFDVDASNTIDLRDFAIGQASFNGS